MFPKCRIPATICSTMARPSAAMPTTLMACWENKGKSRAEAAVRWGFTHSCVVLRPVITSVVVLPLNKNSWKRKQKQGAVKRTNAVKERSLPSSPESHSYRWCRPLCRNQTGWGKCSNPEWWCPGFSSAPHSLLLSAVEQKVKHIWSYIPLNSILKSVEIHSLFINKVCPIWCHCHKTSWLHHSFVLYKWLSDQ